MHEPAIALWIFRWFGCNINETSVTFGRLCIPVIQQFKGHPIQYLQLVEGLVQMLRTPPRSHVPTLMFAADLLVSLDVELYHRID